MPTPDLLEGAVYEIDVPLVEAPRRKRTAAGKGINRSRPPQLCPYSLNWKLHWAVKNQHAKTIVQGVMLRARNLKIPKSEHLTVQLHWSPGDNRSADTDNLVLSFKHACDALARPERKTKVNAWMGLHLVPDDTQEYMTKLEPVIHPGPEHKRRLWITVKIGRPDRP